MKSHEIVASAVIESGATGNAGGVANESGGSGAGDAAAVTEARRVAGQLEQQALRRRERLRELRERRAKADSGASNGADVNEPLPGPLFRNYKPIDDDLKEVVLPDAPAGNVTEEIKDQLDAANVKVVIDELDITNLAPRKPDWDLKRDVAKKLEKLERRTQKAIAELIWERLKEGQGDNINAMVTLATAGPIGKKL